MFRVESLDLGISSSIRRIVLTKILMSGGALRYLVEVQTLLVTSPQGATVFIVRFPPAADRSRQPPVCVRSRKSETRASGFARSSSRDVIEFF